MLDFIYTLFIAPLEFGMDKALSWGYEISGNWGWAIIIMSIVVNTVILPIYLKAEHWQEEERSIRKSFENDEAMIKRTFKGQERFAMITTMHRQAGYSPLLTLRSSIGFFLQIPFFFAAYHLLSHFEPLQGISFLGLTDLSKPDELFKIGDFAINVMPILMTIINIASALIYTQNLTNRDKYQLYGMAAIFLVLLYNAASGLVLYWTFNNIYSLAKNAVLQNTGYKGGKAKATKYLMPSYVWTLPLGIALPFAFLWANNIFAYSFGSLFFCSLLVLSASLIAGYFLRSLANRFNLQKNKLFILIYALILGFTLCFLSLSLIKGAFYAYRWHFVWILPLLCWILISCFGFRFLNILITSQLVLSIGLACFNIGSDYKATQEFNRETTSYEFIQFEKKPNIYLFFCESYQNLDTVKEAFGYDSSDFLKQLSTLGMTIHNTYSNSLYTLGSLRDLTTMSYRFKTIGNLDAFTSERDIFAGGANNKLLRILKENGYETTFYLNGAQGFFTKKAKYLDNTDFESDWRLLLLYPIIDVNYHIEEFLNRFFLTPNTIKSSDLDVLKEFSKKHINSDKPQFYLHYLITAFHTPSDGSYDYTMKTEWTKNAGYQQRIKEANLKVLSIVEYLRNTDPNAIIIFIGDHGPWRVRYFPFDFDNRSNNQVLLANVNETYQSVIDDLFHVFAAIYYPKGFQPLNKFSHINLFPKLFRQLAPSSNEQIDKIEQKENYSIYEEQVMAIDGKPETSSLFWDVPQK